MSPDKMAYIECLLDMVPDMKETHTIKYDSIRTFYTRERVKAMTSPSKIDQVVRVFLLYIFGTTLFVDTASSLDLIFLMFVRDLDWVSSFDWSGCALACLYKSMDEVARGAKRFCGFWYAVLVSFLSFLSDSSRCSFPDIR